MAYLDATGLATQTQYIKAYVNNQITHQATTGTAAKATADAAGNVITTTYATKTYADNAASTAVSGVVGNAPSSLNTLEELATALGNDPNFASTIASQLSGKVSTTSANYIKSASVSNNVLTLTKGDNTTVTFQGGSSTIDWSNITNAPTDISDFNNDAGYLTSVDWTDIDNVPSTFTPASHNQASNTINALTGYSKPSSTSALGTSDTLNAALGKLEKALDGKQNAMTITTGSNNGTLSVDGVDISVKGLDSAAYTPKTDYLSLSTNEATLIADSTDLNSLITPGSYYSNGSTKSQTLSNTPITTSAFRLYVYNTGVGNYRMQVASNYQNTFIRYYNASTWTTWSSIVTSNMNRSIEYIKGTQTAATGSFTGVTADGALYDGKTIFYYLPYAGSGNATLNLTLSGGGTTGAKTIRWTGSTQLTTHYAAGSVISLTYVQSADEWRRADYNTNTDTKVNVTLGTTTKAYLLGTSTTPTSTAAGVTTIADTGVYLNTTAGNLYATTFNTGGNITMGGTSGTSYLQLPSGIKLY